MDIILMVILSFVLHRLCKQKEIRATFWIYRFVSLSIGFELCIGLIFASIYGIDFIKDLKQMLTIGILNLVVIFLLFLLVKRNINKSILDDRNDSDNNDPTPPEKDLSYFR